MRHHAVLLSLALGWCASACSAPASRAGAAAPPHDVALEAHVDSVATAALRETPLPSLSVALARGSRVLLAKAYGQANLELGVPADTQTVYRVGSITKQFTAAAILRLAEQGRLGLDDDITTHLPRFRAHGRRITIRQLLDHTSGLRSFTEIPAFGAKARLDLSDDELLALFQDEPLEFAPGTNFLYNNSGYYLLGMVIERLSGRAHGDYLRDELFTPLGLHATRACDDDELLPHRAAGYTVAAGRLRNAAFMSMAPPKGGGNLCATAADLVTWTRALVDGRVVDRASYARMAGPSTLADGRPLAYGAGLFLTRFAGHDEISHGGGIGGFTGFVAYYPADSLTVVVLTNSDAAHLYDGRLARRIARLPLGIAAPPPVAAGTTGALDRFAGTYRIGSASIVVRARGGRLALEGEATVQQLSDGEFVPSGPDTFTAVDDPELRAHFTPERNGAMRLALTVAGRAYGDAVRR